MEESKEFVFVSLALFVEFGPVIVFRGSFGAGLGGVAIEFSELGLGDGDGALRDGGGIGGLGGAGGGDGGVGGLGGVSGAEGAGGGVGGVSWARAVGANPERFIMRARIKIMFKIFFINNFFGKRPIGPLPKQASRQIYRIN